MFDGIFHKLQEKKPYVHCITNYVTANDCANIVLAWGARPVMADSVCEAEEITAGCDALVINMGTLSESKISAMLIAGRKANELNHSVILDPVGVGASSFRQRAAFQLLDEIRFSVIRGNASEIRTLYYGFGKTKGVDAGEKDKITEDTINEACKTAALLAKRTKAVIVLTGSTDIVTDGKTMYLIRNGHSSMSKISGTGCMLSAIIGVLCAALNEEPLKAAAAGTVLMGLCGEIAYGKITERKEGTASLKIHLIDAIGMIDEEMLKERAFIEKVRKEYGEDE